MESCIFGTVTSTFCNQLKTLFELNIFSEVRVKKLIWSRRNAPVLRITLVRVEFRGELYPYKLPLVDRANTCLAGVDAALGGGGQVGVCLDASKDAGVGNDACGIE